MEIYDEDTASESEIDSKRPEMLQKVIELLREKPALSQDKIKQLRYNLDNLYDFTWIDSSTEENILHLCLKTQNPDCIEAVISRICSIDSKGETLNKLRSQSDKKNETPNQLTITIFNQSATGEDAIDIHSSSFKTKREKKIEQERASLLKSMQAKKATTKLSIFNTDLLQKKGEPNYVKILTSLGK